MRIKLFYFLLVSFSILGLSYFSLPAEALGTCECYTTTTWLSSCAECATFCAGEEAEGRTMSQKLCADSTDVPGAKDCACHVIIERVESEDCRRGCAGYNYNFTEASEEIPIEEGEVCSRQEDCVGGGTCGADRCFCNPSTNRCKFKKDSGSVCLENYECHSNICTPVPGGEGKTCKLGGLTPPGEETPPPEGEAFPTYQLKSPIGEVTGPELIGRIIKAVLGVVGALALAMFVFGGFTWLTSGGSPDKIKKGKDILMWAVIGLIIIFTSYTLVDFILTAFGL